VGSLGYAIYFFIFVITPFNLTGFNLFLTCFITIAQDFMNAGID